MWMLLGSYFPKHTNVLRIEERAIVAPAGPRTNRQLRETAGKIAHSESRRAKFKQLQ
jgi:hypothetical protein